MTVPANIPALLLGSSGPYLPSTTRWVGGGLVQSSQWGACPQRFNVKVEGGEIFYQLYDQFTAWTKWTGAPSAMSALSYGTGWRNEGEGFRIATLGIAGNNLNGTVNIYDANIGWRWTGVAFSIPLQ